MGTLTTTLGSHDRMVLAGAIGEHAAPVRNAANEPPISADVSDCELLVVPGHEDRMIAQRCRQILTNLENTP